MSVEMPTLRTERLVLRPFTPGDAADVQRLAGDAAIADGTLTIPHPYEDGVAEAWIANSAEAAAAGTGFRFAVTDGTSGALLGAAGLEVDPQHEHAEIGYWIGRPHWRRGYATEAARAVLAFGFATLGCHKIFGRVFVGNPGSRRLLEQLGMRYEGCQRQQIKKADGFRDVELFGVLRSEWRDVRQG